MPRHRRLSMSMPRRNYLVVFQWKKGIPDDPATFRFHKGAGLPLFPEPSNPGPQSRKAVTCSAGLMKQRPIGGRTSSAPATDANRSDVLPTSVSALLAPPSIDRLLSNYFDSLSQDARISPAQTESLQDVQKGRPARPHQVRRRGVRLGTLSL